MTQNLGKNIENVTRFEFKYRWLNVVSMPWKCSSLVFFFEDISIVIFMSVVMGSEESRQCTEKIIIETTLGIDDILLKRIMYVDHAYYT